MRSARHGPAPAPAAPAFRMAASARQRVLPAIALASSGNVERHCARNVGAIENSTTVPRSAGTTPMAVQALRGGEHRRIDEREVARGRDRRHDGCRRLLSIFHREEIRSARARRRPKKRAARPGGVSSTPSNSHAADADGRIETCPMPGRASFPDARRRSRKLQVRLAGKRGRATKRNQPAATTHEGRDRIETLAAESRSRTGRLPGSAPPRRLRIVTVDDLVRVAVRDHDGAHILPPPGLDVVGRQRDRLEPQPAQHEHQLAWPRSVETLPTIDTDLQGARSASPARRSAAPDDGRGSRTAWRHFACDAASRSLPRRIRTPSADGRSFSFDRSASSA